MDSELTRWRALYEKSPAEFQDELAELVRSGARGAPAILAWAALHDIGKATQEFEETTEAPAASVADQKSLGAGSRTRKISVSMPEDLSVAVRERVGPGEFSRYVADAVARQLELDLLVELSSMLEDEHGPVSEGVLAEAEAAWPDAD